MTDENPRDAAPRAVQACHELLVWLIPQLDLFPRARRFTLGERLESGLLRVLEALVEAAYSREKRAALAAGPRTAGHPAQALRTNTIFCPCGRVATPRGANRPIRRTLQDGNPPDPANQR